MVDWIVLNALKWATCSEKKLKFKKKCLRGPKGKRKLKVPMAIISSNTDAWQGDIPEHEIYVLVNVPLLVHWWYICTFPQTISETRKQLLVLKLKKNSGSSSRGDTYPNLPSTAFNGRAARLLPSLFIQRQIHKAAAISPAPGRTGSLFPLTNVFWMMRRQLRQTSQREAWCLKSTEIEFILLQSYCRCADALQ